MYLVRHPFSFLLFQNGHVPFEFEKITNLSDFYKEDIQKIKRQLEKEPIFVHQIISLVLTVPTLVRSFSKKPHNLST